MKINNIFISFILGGLIVSLVSFVADYFNPFIGSIIWAYPITLIPIIYSLKMNNKSNIFISKFLISGTYSLIILFLTTYAMSYYFKYENTEKISIPIFKASIVWAILSYIFYLIIINLGLSKYFI